MSTVVAVVGQHAAAIAAHSSNYTIVATPHGPQVAAGGVFGAHPKLVAANGRAAGVAGGLGPRVDRSFAHVVEFRSRRQ